MERWPLAVKAAVFPLVLLTLMTYVVMPLVTRVLRRWLGPREVLVTGGGRLSGDPALRWEDTQASGAVSQTAW